jgi:glutamine amidotransferase
MIAIIDYGAGNTKSVANAVESLGAEFIVTKSEVQVLKADKIIIPGVGEASFALRKLSVMNLSNVIKMQKKPTLGICLGLQILCDHSEESDTSCLGCLSGNVKAFDPGKGRVPHMGWNSVDIVKETPLFTGIPDGSYFYFAHSFYVPYMEETIAVCEYQTKFSAAANRNNFYGVQFHPEKSAEQGLKVLSNFIELC